MPFPELSAILSVHCYTWTGCSGGWEPGWPVWHVRASCKQSSMIFPTLCLLLIISSFSACCGCCQWLRPWSGAGLDTPHCPTCPSCSSRTQLCIVPCAIIIIPITSHGDDIPRCLDLGKGFTSRGEINPKQFKKPKSKCLQVSIQVKAPVTAGADVFCFQAARTSEQLRS